MSDAGLTQYINNHRLVAADVSYACLSNSIISFKLD